MPSRTLVRPRQGDGGKGRTIRCLSSEGVFEYARVNLSCAKCKHEHRRFEIGAAKMNANRSSEPRFNIIIWKGAKQLGTLRDRDASRARSNFGGVVARYKNSTDNHRVELYDGADLIEAWSSQDGNKAPSAETPVPASEKIHRERECVGRAIPVPCQLVPSRSAKA